MFHTYSEEPAQNISADEIFWVVTFIFLKSLLLVTPRGVLCFCLSLWCHRHAGFCVNCLSQALANSLSFVLFVKSWTHIAFCQSTGDLAPYPAEATPPSNENRQVQHTGSHANGNPRKMVLGLGIKQGQVGFRERIWRHREAFGRKSPGKQIHTTLLLVLTQV